MTCARRAQVIDARIQRDAGALTRARLYVAHDLSPRERSGS